jgi:hypothetical protein
MMPPATGAFAAFAQRKEQAAVSAALEPFKTIADHSASLPLEAVSSEFTDALLDGPFFQSPVLPGPAPSISLVFVQSRDGNTEAHDPSTLGGGETDKHVIYEGLSRVAADAVPYCRARKRSAGAIFCSRSGIRRSSACAARLASRATRSRSS